LAAGRWQHRQVPSANSLRHSLRQSYKLHIKSGHHNGLGIFCMQVFRGGGKVCGKASSALPI